MTRKGNIQWLLGELPGWVGQGVLTPEQAESLRRHYRSAQPAAGRGWLLTLFAILGAVLIGFGIILLLAHNWEQISRPVRAGMSLALLLFGQVMAGRAVVRQAAAAGLREASSAFLMLVAGASLALIAQTYHVAADMESFILTWMLLGLPLVYTHRAVLPAVFYLAGVSSWSLMALETCGPTGYWLLIALLLPFLWARIREDRYQARAALLLWGLAVSLLILSGVITGEQEDEYLLLMFSLLLASFYLADALWLEGAPTAWQRPTKLLGAGGIVIMAFILSFEWEAGRLSFQEYAAFVGGGLSGVLLGVCLPLLYLATAGRAVLGGRGGRMVFGVFPLLVWIGVLAGQGRGWLIANGYLFGLGLFLLVSGARQRQLGKTNGGMLILGALIIIRFFDSDLSFVAKGIVFILLGLGFLGANWIMLRRKGGAP
ncbi:MAG TPA: DUF2157 domain-containing protein [Kiritimatiellia bacterium]|nr:DUF2157 domain-containing protein [Kiritimatiellia bacterium]HRZ11068.1 DUF2157 domain-containing protein [Kiritimatiellia bacterium]HSA18641.1 DUF2157 domain-containing protein [Kiritimatiellia bacterium]